MDDREGFGDDVIFRSEKDAVVTIYPNAVVLGKIHIGDGAVILAGSVVLHDVCQNGIVGGNPAVLKKVAKI